MEPLGYFITFSCYGTWLHGDARGSVDCRHNLPGTLFLPPDEDFNNERRQFKAAPYFLDAPRRRVVVGAVREIAGRKHWALLAVRARSNHVHIVVRAPAPSSAS